MRRKPVRITDRIAFDALETADGKSVYYLSYGPGTWKVSSNGGDSSHIPELRNYLCGRYFALSDRAIYIAAQETEPRQILRFDLKTRRVSQAGKIPGEMVIDTSSLSISPDDRVLLFAQQDQGSSDIVMLSRKQ